MTWCRVPVSISPSPKLHFRPFPINGVEQYDFSFDASEPIFIAAMVTPGLKHRRGRYNWNDMDRWITMRLNETTITILWLY